MLLRSSSIGEGADFLYSISFSDAATGGGAFSWKRKDFRVYQVRAPSPLSLAVAKFPP
jgi:hypothetical protein